jgi:hypothetical protein
MFSFSFGILKRFPCINSGYDSSYFQYQCWLYKKFYLSSFQVTYIFSYWITGRNGRVEGVEEASGESVEKP